MARRVRSFVVVSVIVLQILQVYGKDGKDCEVHRVPRSDPGTPKMIKFSIECSNPQPDDQISAPSDVARTVVEPPQDSPYKSKFAPKPLKLTPLFKKRLVEPMALAGSYSSPVKLPVKDPKIYLQKLRKILKKAPEDQVSAEIPDKLFELPQDIMAALPKPKISLPGWLKKPKPVRTLDTESSNVDPVYAFRNQRPRFPSLFKKAAEEPEKPADLKTLDEALKNTKLKLPHLMATLLKKNPEDAAESAAAHVEFIEDAPKLSKFKESKLYSLLKKPAGDPIMSASSDSAAFEKLPKFEKLKLPKFRSLLKKNDDLESSASSQVNKFAEAPKFSKLSALRKAPEESSKTALSDKLLALKKAPEESIKTKLSEKLSGLKKVPEESMKTTLSEKLSALKKVPEESIKTALSDKLSAFREAPEESIKTALSEKLSALKKVPEEPIKTALSDKLSAFREAPEESIKTTLSEKLSALKKAPEESIKTKLSEKLSGLKKGSEESMKTTLSEKLSPLKKAPEESIKSKLSEKLSGLKKGPEESMKTTLSEKLSPLKKVQEESIKTALSDKLSALRKTAEESSLIKKNYDEPKASASAQVNKFAKAPKLSKLSALIKAPEEPIKTSLSDKLAALKKVPEEPIKTTLSDKLAALNKVPEEPIKTTLSDKLAALKKVPEESIKTTLFDKVAALRKAPEEPIKPALPYTPKFVESSKLKTGELADKVRFFLRKPDDDPVVSLTFNPAEKYPKPVKLEKVKSATLSDLIKKKRTIKEPAGLASEHVPAFKAKSPLKTFLEQSSSHKDMASAASVVEPKQSKYSSLLKKPLLPKKFVTVDKDPLVKSPLLSKLTPKIEMPKARTAEEMTILLDRIRNALSEALVNGKMDPLKGKSLLKKLSLAKDLDEGASDVHSMTAETDQGQASDAEKSASNMELVGSAPDDDMIGLTQQELNSKSCDLCKCFMKAFPQKFGDGSRAASEVKEEIVKPTKLKIPILPSKISNRLREVLKPVDSDSFVAADNHDPSFLPAPENPDDEGPDNELLEIERGVRIQEGIDRLINFVTLVGELDQYVSHKTRSFITKMARLYDGEDHPQLL